MQVQVYPTGDQRVNTDVLGAPSGRHDAQPRTLSDRHRRMLEVESGISPEVIAQRGYWTAHTAAEIPAGFASYQFQAWMFPILVIPQWNSVGRLFAHILRPDTPRRDRTTEKAIKYEAQPGAPVGFDVPPAMVSPLRDPSVPLYITEGSKKADAMASRGLPCLSMNGVYAFLTRKVIVSELDEIDLGGREVRIVFDSDVMTKPGVADALDRLAGAIHRRDGRVQMVTLPDNGDGKAGVDDYFARGGQPADLGTLTTPWEAVRRPRNMWDEPPDTDVDHWKPRALRAEADLRALILLHDNPALTTGEKTLMRRLATEGAAKAARGERTEDGRIQLEPRFLANDHRPEPDRGESRMKRNPDGSGFLMPRSSVRKTAERLRSLGLLDFTEVRVPFTRKHDRTYSVPELLISPPASIADFVAAAAWYAPAVPVSRADYGSQTRCPECGEIHERTVRTTRRTFCGTSIDPGCGAQIGERDTVVTLPVPPASRPDITAHERTRLDQRTSSASIPTKNVDIDSDGIAPSLLPSSNSLPTLNVDIADHADQLWSSPDPIDRRDEDGWPEPTGLPPGWQDDRRLLYGRLYHGEAAS